ncbi:MAG: phage integrase SAM-like domain-containing protein [Flavobacterium sp.]|nr:phage integrase SAM-like domain-containing protein [Flavobacterium sp.]
MATINFLYRSKKPLANLSLRLLYRYNETDLVFGANTKYEVSKEYWSKQHKQKRPKDIEIVNEQTKVKTELNKLENYILAAYKTTDAKAINKEWLQNQVDLYYNPVQHAKATPTALIEYIDFYIDYRKHELKEGLIKKLKVTKHKVERFQVFRKKIILLKDVNDSFKNEFVDYCKSEKYSQNTIERDLAYIKTFCKHARYLGLETSPQLDGLRMDKEKTDSIYLSLEELKKIQEIEKSKLTESLENARDWLIISCFTGQRISDFMRFTDTQIRKENGKTFIEFTQKKTGKTMIIPLHSKVIEILDKKDGKFPYSISDQKYNEYIKTVCRIGEINDKISGSKKSETEENSKVYRKESGIFEKWELVTSHIGRRSFATNHYGKIPTSFLIAATGHSTEVMFLKYIGKSNKDLAMELANYF